MGADAWLDFTMVRTQRGLWNVPSTTRDSKDKQFGDRGRGKGGGPIPCLRVLGPHLTSELWSTELGFAKVFFVVVVLSRSLYLYL